MKRLISNPLQNPTDILPEKQHKLRRYKVCKDSQCIWWWWCCWYWCKCTVCRFVLYIAHVDFCDGWSLKLSVLQATMDWNWYKCFKTQVFSRSLRLAPSPMGCSQGGLRGSVLWRKASCCTMTSLKRDIMNLKRCSISILRYVAN